MQITENVGIKVKQQCLQVHIVQQCVPCAVYIWCLSLAWTANEKLSICMGHESEQPHR